MAVLALGEAGDIDSHAVCERIDTGRDVAVAADLLTDLANRS